MNHVKLLKLGENSLKQYCLNRSYLFYIEEVDFIGGKNFNICKARKSWINKQCNLNVLAKVEQDENTKECFVELTRNILWDLDFKDLKEFIDFLDKIRDKNGDKNGII